MSEELSKAQAEAEALAAAAAQAAKDAEAAKQRLESLQATAPAPEAPESDAKGPLSDEAIALVKEGYAFEGTALELGALLNGGPRSDVQIRIPLAMLNRHGLIAGATGTGKTKTLQGIAEQLSSAGVSVFAADIKGDLSGVATAGAASDKLTERTRAIGQDWVSEAFPTEFFSLGGIGSGVPIRATVTSFGPLLLSKVLGLNETQESSLELVFLYADQNGLPLVDLADLKTTLVYLTSEEGKDELTGIGGLSKQTVGVILREVSGFEAAGASEFFGETEIDTAEFMRTAADGRGIISMLEVPGVADRPELYSTFLMWLLADLFNGLPEVGDVDKPKLVFFFDEAHLLFKDASKAFLTQVTQTVRLIRSKGVGVFFVTQTPKDVPADVLAQLGSRVQHQLRAFTPDDAKALRQTVNTYPKSEYDLEEVLTTLGIGEAIVTVMNERGAPSPVAWTRLRAPEASMDPTPKAQMDAIIQASSLAPKYSTRVDPESAHEKLTARMAAAEEAVRSAEAAEAAAEAEADRLKAQAKADAALAKANEKAQRDLEKLQRERSQRSSTSTRSRSRSSGNPLDGLFTARTKDQLVGKVVRGIFGTLFKGR